MKPTLKGLLLSTALSAALVPAAMAQEGDNPFLRGRYTSVTERPQPEFDPEPVRAGAFNIWSSLGVAAEYNDNVFAEQNNEDSDTIVRIQPSIEARSNWTSHEVSAGLNIDHAEHMDIDSETTTDFFSFLQGRIDVSRNFLLRLGADASHRTEERYEAASFGASEPASLDNVGAFAQATYRQDRIQVDGTVGIAQDEYDQAIQQIRDNTTTYVNGRVSYAISPDIAVFVQGRREEQDYDTSDRDGTRTTVDAGVNFELGAPFRGEIAVGSFKDERDAAIYGDESGLNVSANVQWFPTQLTTVTFSANRGAMDPGLAASASAVNTAYGIRVDHELMRNLLLFGTLRQETFDYGGPTFDREDDALSFSIGGAWKLNKNARFEVQYSGRSQDSSGADAGPDLEQNIISAGIRIYP
jgi:hypothetical protein